MTQLEQIQQVERRLLAAMLNSDVTELNRLLSDELLATGPTGELFNKADDLAAHRDGVIRIESMVARETTIKLLPNAAIVFALMDMRGFFQSQPVAGRYRYTRLCTNQKEKDRWQIITAHISQVAD